MAMAIGEVSGRSSILIETVALFIWLIIHLIQLVFFSAGTVFFSHKKSANSVFQPAYNSSRTAPVWHNKSFICISKKFISQLLNN
jgi:hypothetical protein